MTVVTGMPVFRYSPVKAPCKLCGQGFDHHQDPNSAALQECPRCGQEVIRANVQAVNTPKIMKPLSISDAKKAGFTVLKRISSGEFEKQ